MTTALSRRRVSCRELGRPDCDGWLWKKRKESSVFIAQKWQRFWFVLKGPSLYWYTSQQVGIFCYYKFHLVCALIQYCESFIMRSFELASFSLTNLTCDFTELCVLFCRMRRRRVLST